MPPESATGNSFLRKLSGRDPWKSSKRSCRKQTPENNLSQIDGLNLHDTGIVGRKRVMAVVDSTNRSKQAMMWALTHVTNKGDLLTLLQILPPLSGTDEDPSLGSGGYQTSHLANTHASLCKACRPEVEVEALVIQGPKLSTVVSQVKKLEVSVLVLGQKKPSRLSCLFKSSSEGFVEDCIKHCDCSTLAVRKQSKGVCWWLSHQQSMAEELLASCLNYPRESKKERWSVKSCVKHHSYGRGVFLLKDERLMNHSIPPVF